MVRGPDAGEDRRSESDKDWNTEFCWPHNLSPLLMSNPDRWFAASGACRHPARSCLSHEAFRLGC
jgi:hypothetical protein